jgi:hypothetical protein
MTVSLVTHGWVCYSKRTIINRYVLPMDLQIKMLDNLILDLKNKTKLDLSINQIKDRNINLKLTEHNINIKKSSIVHIGVNKCSQDL